MSYIILLIISDIVMIALAIYGWRQRSRYIARLFLATVACLFIWITAVTLECLSTTLPSKLFWSNIAFLGTTYLPMLWFLVILEYTKHKESWRRYYPLLFIVPTITNVIIWTNTWHHWWQGAPLLDVRADFLPLIDDYQLWFYTIQVWYSFAFFLVSCLLLVQKLRVSRGVYRRQIWILLVSTVLPMFSEAINLAGIISGTGLSPTPIVLAVSGILLTVIFSQDRFLDLMPVARDTLFEKMNDSMLAIDEQCRIVDLNPSMQFLLNTSPEDAIGQYINTFIPEWDLDLTTICDEIKTHHEITIERNDIQRQYDLQISPLQSSGRDVTGQMIVLHDITHRVRMENDLRLQNEELKAFSHTVAHDLRNPLALISGFNELLSNMLTDNNDPQVEEVLGIIDKTTHTMDGIIDSLLLLAQVREENITLQNIDMVAIVAEVMERLQFSILEAEATVIQPDNWPDVIGYAPWVEEVWVNYISNGLKYGGQPPQLKLGFTAQEDDMVRFWVQDDGLGIELSDQASLFTEFTRLDTIQAEGHGLGLSIVRRIVTRLGGSVGVDSTVGEGSRFYFNLPITAVSEPLTK